VFASPQLTVIPERTESVVALLAAGGLLALTTTAVIRASSQPQLVYVVMMILAWIAVLASALLARRRPQAAAAERLIPQESTVGAPPRQPRHDPPARVAALDHLPPPDQPESAKADERWSDALLEFAQDALGALQSDRLQLLIAQRLPALVGRKRKDVWVVTNFAGQQHVVLPARVDSEQPSPMLGDEPRQWATFPLKAEGQTIGVLGIELANAGLTARERRMITSVSGVLARALKTSEAFEVMREATLVDPLTGCATRAEGMRRFEAELRRAERSKSSLAVLLLDLDHFKSINDRYGHNTGDAVLSAVGETLLSTLRASDIRCRWGGEEFLVVLPESTIDRARAAAESLRQRIANASAREGPHAVRTTTSIGITIARPGETDIPRLLGRADSALYQAKSGGRNRIMAVLGDTGQAVSGSPYGADEAVNGPSSSTEPERRDSSHSDRRLTYGRRRTDVITGPWVETP
jgi:diguanylate cyclase (GGDEF)-like protein